MNEELESKIKLYCALCGNNVLIMDESAFGRKENHCERCRAKHEGICNIRHNNRQIMVEKKTGKIIKISKGGYLKKEWKEGRDIKAFVFDKQACEFIFVENKIYYNNEIDFYWFCFGFLRDE